MIKPIYLLACAPFLFVGCTTVVERPVPVATAEVRHDVVTPGPGYTREIIVTRTPPPVRVEQRPRSPGARYVWRRGHWRWTGVDYQWVPGRWVVRPRPAAVWVEGSWVRRRGGWVWVEGSWR